MESKKILDYLEENGIIRIEDVETEMRRKEISHTLFVLHPYTIYQGGDSRWRTYIKTESGRKLIVKSKKEDLEDLLYKLYKTEEKKTYTLEELYPEWLEYKKLHTDAPTYIERIDRFWKKFYIGDPIIRVPISNLDKVLLDRWAHNLIKEHNLDKKTYYNITLIIRQALDYAVEIGALESNKFIEFKIDKRLFRKVAKKESFKEVFSIEETRLLKEYAMKNFLDGTHRNQPLLPLAILFQLQTGIRLGELRALMLSDILEDSVSITKFIRSEPGELVEHTKGTYGDRLIPLTDEARCIVNLAIKKKKELGKISCPFLFSITDAPLSSSAIDHTYYIYCERLGFFKKSSHKARKTVISSLIDAGLNINTIREIAGHTDERTTYNSYCYDRSSDETRKRLMNETLK